MPSPDPWIYTLPGVAFTPDLTRQEFFTAGDSFTISVGIPNPPGFGKLTLTLIDFDTGGSGFVCNGDTSTPNLLTFVYQGTANQTVAETIGDIKFDATALASAIVVTYNDHFIDPKTGVPLRRPGRISRTSPSRPL